jgi:DNA-binding NarL/FixJ family response regulator
VALSGRAPPAALVDVLMAETEGNPFFVGEVYRYLAEAGRLIDAAGAWREDVAVAEGDVPQSVRLVIEQRLSRLSAECQRLLAVAAVIGREFAFSLLDTVGAGGALEALEEAQRASLVQDSPAGREARYRFTHELIRQTLLVGLARPRRQRLHLQVARALAPLVVERDDLAPEIAYHMFEAGDAAEAAETVRYLTLAGEQAVVVAAVDEGLQLYQKALDVAAGIAPGEARRRLEGELRAKRGLAHASLGRWTSARADIEASLAGHPEPDARRAEQLVHLCQSSFWSLDDPREQLHRYAREAVALARAVARPDLVAAAIGWQATADSAAGDLGAAAEGFARALAQAEEASVAAPPFALQYFSLMLYWTGRHEDATRRGAEAIERFSQLNDVAGLVNVLPSQGLALAARGRYEEAERSFREAVRLGRRYGIGTLLARAIAMSGGPRLDAFDYPAAEELAEEARDLARTFAYAPPLISATIDLLFVGARRHDLGRVAELATEVEAGMATAGAWHAWGWRIRYAQARAEIALARRDWPEALRLSEVAIAESQAMGRRRYEVMALDTGAAALSGLGRSREAIARLRRAVALARALGHAALFLRPAAALLDRAGDPTLLAEATATAHRLADALPDQTWRLRFREAAPVRRFVAGAQSHLPAGGRAPAHPDHLSEREVEVLRLIAAGKSNPQIAAALVLSINTVERHVTHILQKSGTANRAEAAAYATRHGLTG